MVRQEFDIKIFGNVSSFLGWEVSRDIEIIYLTQLRYIEDLLSKHGLLVCNGSWTPLPINANLRPVSE